MKTQVQNNTTYYHLIVDKSGSMCGSVDVTLSTINEQLQTIKSISAKSPDQKILTGITLFDTDLKHLHFASDINTIETVTPEQYSPGGMTALLDAIGKSVIGLESQVQHEIQQGKASVVVVVITDGYENSSKLFKFDQIREMIQRLESSELWSFTYLGADLSDISEAQKMGFSAASTRLIEKTELPVYSSFLSESMEMYIDRKKNLHTVKASFLKDDE